MYENYFGLFLKCMNDCYTTDEELHAAKGQDQLVRQRMLAMSTTLVLST